MPQTAPYPRGLWKQYSRRCRCWGTCQLLAGGKIEEAVRLVIPDNDSPCSAKEQEGYDACGHGTRWASRREHEIAAASPPLIPRTNRSFKSSSLGRMRATTC